MGIQKGGWRYTGRETCVTRQARVCFIHVLSCVIQCEQRARALPRSLLRPCDGGEDLCVNVPRKANFKISNITV